DLSADGRWLFSAGSEERVRLIDTTTGKEVQSIKLPDPDRGEAERLGYHIPLHAESKQAAAWFRPPGRLGGGGQPAPGLAEQIATWDLATGKLAALQPVRKMSSARAITHDGRSLVVAGSLMDAATGMELRSLEGTDPNYSGGPVAFSADGRLVIGGCEKL